MKDFPLEDAARAVGIDLEKQEDGSYSGSLNRKRFTELLMKAMEVRGYNKEAENALKQAHKIDSLEDVPDACYATFKLLAQQMEILGEITNTKFIIFFEGSDDKPLLKMNSNAIFATECASKILKKFQQECGIPTVDLINKVYDLMTENTK